VAFDRALNYDFFVQAVGELTTFNQLTYLQRHGYAVRRVLQAKPKTAATEFARHPEKAKRLNLPRLLSYDNRALVDNLRHYTATHMLLTTEKAIQLYT